MAIDVFVDSSDEFFDAAENAAAQLILRQAAKEPLYYVEPRATGRREVHVEGRMASQLALDLGVFVRGAIIHDHVNLLVAWNHVLDSA